MYSIQTMNRDEKWLLEEKYQGEATPDFLADCQRLACGEPLAHIIGWVPFLNCKIYLKADAKAKQSALIPRPETEYWTEKAISEIKASGIKKPRVLDLCSGSGCIGVVVAKALPEAYVDFGEMHPDHLLTIATNINTNLPHNAKAPVKSSRSELELDDLFVLPQYRVFAADLFAPTLASSSSDLELEFGRYDFILSNPPYIDPELDRTEPSVKDYESHLALYGGTAGLELITRIISEAPRYLEPGGVLYLEHEPEQAAAIAAIAADTFNLVTNPDQYGVLRYSRLQLKNKPDMAQ